VLFVAYCRIGIYSDDISFCGHRLQDLPAPGNPKVDEAFFCFAQCLDQIVMGKLRNLVRFLDDEAFPINVKCDFGAFPHAGASDAPSAMLKVDKHSGEQ